MDAIQKEFENRRDEIRMEVEMLFKTNMTITDWDIPEVDDKAAAKVLLSLIQEALDEIKADVEAGKYDFY
ncbi:MAG: hypothetical protein AB7U44_07260 [Sulfuricurvum sp.]|uniref:hypothetical protein n=1 Tax=Sulfuricurvum sp. TaxID=2025608 RepID=UPI00262CA3A7|nr:hypothetical protein [Sulfuricurvum sp.]MDD2839027.1 hypothetical protein [Sulfuricurvum sp.]MDD3597552.1 hypothetical protein [Sulfuricurvum sp.]MDD3598105.1 hypothetical protein [Sulfuricurvum sp.]MDD4884447.1 hypothetical protein [Sulfuricurvum sp.]